MLTVRAPAKINWFLKVLGLRGDGFHEVQSLIQKISLYDELTFSLHTELRLDTDVPGPVEDNLVYKAAVLLKNISGTEKGAFIRLVKNIPAGAGLGGGSSDAAAALYGLNQFWSLHLSPDELAGLAGQIGSDVPFFLCGPLSFVYGRGEKTKPYHPENTANLLLVKPPFPISTARAYQALDELRASGSDKETDDVMDNPGPMLTKKAAKDNNIRLLISRIISSKFNDLTDIVPNDLEPVAVMNYPIIAEIKSRLLNEGALYSVMSGSGSVVYGVFDSFKAAEKAANAFQSFWTAAVRTLRD